MSMLNIFLNEKRILEQAIFSCYLFRCIRNFWAGIKALNRMVVQIFLFLVETLFIF